jgi:hypothetical protein
MEKETHQVLTYLDEAGLTVAPECNGVITGYEIHMGLTTLDKGVRPFSRIFRRGVTSVSIEDGAVSHDGRIFGTYLHGITSEGTLSEEEILGAMKPKTLERWAPIVTAAALLVLWQLVCSLFGIAAQMMRRILIDHARHQARDKRGGPAPKLSLDEAMATADTESDVDLLALDDALTALAQIDPRGAQIIELRFFSGLSLEETAEVVGVSAGTVKRDWSAARAWLYREMRQQS